MLTAVVGVGIQNPQQNPLTSLIISLQYRYFAFVEGRQEQQLLPENIEEGEVENQEISNNPEIQEEIMSPPTPEIQNLSLNESVQCLRHKRCRLFWLLLQKQSKPMARQTFGLVLHMGDSHPRSCHCSSSQKRRHLLCRKHLNRLIQRKILDFWGWW
jgi:hypothetical protein